MAVLTGIYGKKKPEYEGCVLDTYEHNGYDDSDWYAVCWNREKKDIDVVEYDTTRAGGGGWAQIDATEEVIREVYRYHYNKSRLSFDDHENENLAKMVSVGDEVKVIRGTKVPKGTTGKVFWVGERRNNYTYKMEKRAGVVKENGEKVFLPYEYLEVTNWKDRLLRGKARKEHIKRSAINAMPVRYRKYFS